MRVRIARLGVIVATIVALLVPVGRAPASAWADAPTAPSPTASPPTTAPVANPVVPDHDWRAPGYVAAVGGQLYDPSCVPLRSLGSNVPNLPYHGGADADLEWLRSHHVRWVRVFATGHGSGPFPSPRDAADAVRALRALLARVEAFDSRHGPSESIYVLISLTDYYPPGVPGDRYAFDHPIFQLSPVLPAPWFRPGVRAFDFAQEHDQGTMYGMPNYEVSYKPWVEEIVSSLAASPAILGWQLGNELKARNSPRNGISVSEAYDWYLAFTRDVVDTIRAADRHHLIFLGAQYIAELNDWEYRPHDHLDPERVPKYRELVTRMLDDCGQACWNVWSVTDYDFNPYPVDDVVTFERAGVPVVATEYGFTRGSPGEMAKRFGGDRVAAVRDGLARPWDNLAGQTEPAFWSVPELFSIAGLAGLAPWGSPAPGPTAAFDTDSVRGVTGAPDGPALWDAWADVGADLEAANQHAGPSKDCLGVRS